MRWMRAVERKLRSVGEGAEVTVSFNEPTIFSSYHAFGNKLRVRAGNRTIVRDRRCPSYASSGIADDAYATKRFDAHGKNI